ncbi:mechanosensitive ion channel family protein [Mucilaginibacter gotjawali]|uniref:Small-conductance mechanosensitive channel n=2 Tax=Mucilaginibacter gotjawali TaxID=1550579 RepID=A0A839SEP6_9SPHI|nr:mechanosensitive ion channel domain-containing protein [Mucilaginibacter gotjawali]MBB3055762.1 small-conductance mechanosensitive channel [Mucilaginibacter gotjawali]BAU54583.1 Mechanosensitive channel MscK precursor [Mucilaginibacter gotjawali]
MFKITKITSLIIVAIALFSSVEGYSQTKEKDKDKKAVVSKREAARRGLHKRDSLMRSLNRSDTSINSLLQRIEQYTTTFNQIKNNLAEGLDTADVSEQLPQVAKRLDKIAKITDSHKASTLRYLFVIRDNLDRIQDRLEESQSDLDDINTKLVQNQKDLIKFAKDTTLKTVPYDSLARRTFFTQLKTVKILWHRIDSVNRVALLKVNLLQDKASVSYTKALDEDDQIDAKISGFATKALSGETSYIWSPDRQYNDFSSAFNSTVRLNNLLLGYFIKSQPATHFIGIIFLVLVFIWIIYTRSKALKNHEDSEKLFNEANYICKRPVISSLLMVTVIVPYFYNHPPTVLLEGFFLLSMVLALILIRKEIPKDSFNFLIGLFALAFGYSISNLFIEISNVDRYLVFALSILSIALAFSLYKKYKKSPEQHLPNTGLALQVFIALQGLSLILNITGRFSLAKIAGVTAVFNLWLVVTLFLVIRIIIQGLYLQFQIKRSPNSIINWIDYNLVQKKFKKTLILIGSLLWLFFLLQNLNIDDWASDNLHDIFTQKQAVGDSSFTLGGFIVFIFVIWLSSIVSKVISYLFDISAQRVTDLSVLKRKNRTSALIIRIGVFSVGFLLAVAASGFPIDKLTIIISAFGVGIGFGLQNIVNNLVSGLIMAFEKPINIGDVIQVDGHMGTMREIGIRASKVVTGDGSEVIIPNGDFISHQVINWTLSNSNRQIDLRIITAYGVDIAKVKDLLKNLLINHDDIMTTPAPAVLVNNVSESAIEFKVLFWVADINKTGEIKSKILAEIYSTIDREQIPLPSTQKDIKLFLPDGTPVDNQFLNPGSEGTKSGSKKGFKENPPDPGQ